MPKRNLVWILAVIAAAGVMVWVTRQYRPQPSGVAPGEFNGVPETYDLIKERYYRPLDDTKLRIAAVEGMVSSLDEFSSYVPPASMAAFDSRIRGMERGLGLCLEQAGGGIRVIGPLIHSPAHKAGILAGDALLAVDGEPVAGRDLAQVEQLLCGEIGTQAELLIERDDGWRKTLVLTRGEFPLESVEGLYRDTDGHWVHLIEPDAALAYVRVKEFVPDTGDKLQGLLRGLHAIRGLVLDLRDNPGGMLPAGVETANLFLRGGVIAASVGRNGVLERYEARADGTFDEVPIVVLIDDRTASAAEIVAGALRFHRRAVIVGTRSRGKGCVQSMLTLPGGLGRANLTTSELLIAGRQPITRHPGNDRWGVDPHPGMEVRIAPDRAKRLRGLRVRAEVLPAPSGRQATTHPATAPGAPHPLYAQFRQLDAQLTAALELLGQPGRMEKILAPPTTLPALDQPATAAATPTNE